MKLNSCVLDFPSDSPTFLFKGNSCKIVYHICLSLQHGAKIIFHTLNLSWVYIDAFERHIYPTQLTSEADKLLLPVSLEYTEVFPAYQNMRRSRFSVCVNSTCKNVHFVSSLFCFCQNIFRQKLVYCSKALEKDSL